MKFSLEESGSQYAVQGYAKGEITIGGKRYAKSLILLPDRIIEDWRPQAFADLLLEDFIQLAELDPELVILGCGAAQQFPHPTLSQPLLERRIGLESMDTAAACRTYNILMAEGRRVVAALLMT